MSMRASKEHGQDSTLDGSADTTHNPHTAVGRSSLAQQTAFEGGSAAGAAAKWEAIDPLEVSEIAREPALIEHLEHGAPSERETGGTETEESEHAEEPHLLARMADEGADQDDGGDEAAGGGPIATAAKSHQHTAPATPDDPNKRHHAPYEHHLEHPKKSQFARSTPYSSHHIHSNRIGLDKHHHKKKGQVGRPGLRYHGKDVFKIKADAPRYHIVSGSRAAQFDVVSKHDVDHDHQRLCINPTHSRDLFLGSDTHKTWCVLAWYGGGHGSAWIPVHLLEGNTAAIRRAVNKLAKHDDPKKANVHKTHLRHYVFRADGDPIARADNKDKNRFAGPHQRGVANHDSDYLQHAANVGHPSYINVCLNLPSKHAPAVAGDVALPGEHFFVALGGSFRREVPMYRAHKWKPDFSQTWVYGFCGKQENGAWVADHNRPGWVPLRTLDKA
jgi:hypothetical protein